MYSSTFDKVFYTLAYSQNYTDFLSFSFSLRSFLRKKLPLSAAKKYLNIWEKLSWLIEGKSEILRLEA